MEHARLQWTWRWTQNCYHKSWEHAALTYERFMLHRFIPTHLKGHVNHCNWGQRTHIRTQTLCTTTQRLTKGSTLCKCPPTRTSATIPFPSTDAHSQPPPPRYPHCFLCLRDMSGVCYGGEPLEVKRSTAPACSLVTVGKPTLANNMLVS